MPGLIFVTAVKFSVYYFVWINFLMLTRSLVRLFDSSRNLIFF